jgi:MFS family permease
MNTTVKDSPIVLPTPSHTRKYLVHAWVITSLLIIFQMINFADKAVLGLVAESVMSELGMSSTQFGFIGSSFFFLFALSGIVVGFVAEKVQTKWIILIMGLSWAILQFPMMFGGGAIALLVTRIILGAAEGPASSITLTHVQGWFEPKTRGFPSTLVASGTTLGPVITAPILAYIIAHPDMGWRWAFGFLGAIGLLWSVVWAFVCKEGPYSHHAKTTQPTAASDSATSQTPSTNSSITEFVDQLKPVAIFRIFFSKMFIVAFLSGLGCFWSLGFLTTWSPKYIAAVGHFSPEIIAAMSSLPWILGALSLSFTGYISRVLFKKGATVHRAIGLPFGLLLLISGLAFFLLPHSSSWACIALVTVAAGFAMTFPLATMAVGFSVNAGQRAAVMATLVATSSIGGIVSPTMVGYLMDHAGYIKPAKGVAASPEMLGNLITGMNTGFVYIGVYLIVVGFITMLFLNPDKTAKSLMK